ncbi:MAG: tetratricopeptide repeat protein [Treponema sp.]|jgi:Ca-activated chloride channel family protein|nr:tetratricopeptide repeat protein [Treponema sp.]
MGKFNHGVAPFPLAALLLLPLLGACSLFPGRLLIIEGNFYQSQGMYTQAISAYLKALDYPEAIPYAEYGLGSSYQALDEGKAALERFNAAEAALGTAQGKPPKGRQELSYRIRYNTGLVLFGEEDFDGAAEAFRGALEIDGSRVEAKRNLELSLLARPQGKTSSAGRGEGGERGNQGAQALFDYLSRKEQNQWRSRQWIEPPPAGPDY